MDGNPETMVTITFDDAAKQDVLDLLDKSIDAEGFVVEKNDPTQRVIASDGEEMTLEEFGGMKRGSQIFIKRDFYSVFALSKQH